jgi:hypothetical protein
MSSSGLSVHLWYVSQELVNQVVDRLSPKTTVYEVVYISSGTSTLVLLTLIIYYKPY